MLLSNSQLLGASTEEGKLDGASDLPGLLVK